MKNVLLSLPLCLCICAVSCSSCNDTDIIPKEQLPVVARDFIDSNFADVELVSVIKDRDWFKTEYDAYLANGVKINFDRVGNWEEVDGQSAALPLPAGIVPPRISAAVQSDFPLCHIVKISKEPHKWEVELNNGIDIEFNNNFNMIKLD